MKNYSQTGPDWTRYLLAGCHDTTSREGAVLLDAVTFRDHPWLMDALQSWQQDWKARRMYQHCLLAMGMVTEETMRTQAV